jgi:hypothetical protein
MRAFNDRLEQAVMDHEADPKQQLKDLGIAYIRFFIENPEYLQLLFFSDLRKALSNSRQQPSEIAFCIMRARRAPWSAAAELPPSVFELFKAAASPPQ